MGTDLQVERAVLGRLVLCPEQRMRNLQIPNEASFKPDIQHQRYTEGMKICSWQMAVLQDYRR